MVVRVSEVVSSFTYKNKRTLKIISSNYLCLFHFNLLEKDNNTHNLEN